MFTYIYYLPLKNLVKQKEQKKKQKCTYPLLLKKITKQTGATLTTQNLRICRTQQ